MRFGAHWFAAPRTRGAILHVPRRPSPGAASRAHCALGLAFHACWIAQSQRAARVRMNEEPLAAGGCKRRLPLGFVRAAAYRMWPWVAMWVVGHPHPADLRYVRITLYRYRDTERISLSQERSVHEQQCVILLFKTYDISFACRVHHLRVRLP